MSNEETIRQQFQRLDGDRSTRLEASKLFAYYTVPSLFPADDNSDTSKGVGMLDSIGSSVVNHFANKLVTTLFSPNRPFFRLEPAPDSEEYKELQKMQNSAEQADKDEAEALMNAFRTGASQVEKDAVAYLEKISYRTAAVELAKLLTVTGDGIIKNPKGSRRPSVYSMRDYVCIKDGEGQDKILIVRDTKTFAAFSEADQVALQNSTTDKTYDGTTDVSVYTKYELQADGRYEVTQATDEVDVLNDDKYLVTQDDMEHTHLSWNLSRGENYGRGLVEDYAGSFHMIDALSRTIAALAARIASQKVMVSPQSNIDVNAMNTSDGSTYVSGDPEAVGTTKLVDTSDIVVLEGIVAVHKRQISNAFLHNTGTTRDAERVTAEEIRENAAELEIAHGGVYSRFSNDWQRKAAKEAVREVDGKLGSDIDPTIVTGMDSLSRQGEMQAIRMWVSDLSLMQNVPEPLQGVIKMEKFANYAAIQRGIEQGAFVMTPEEIAAVRKAEEERQQAQAAAESAGRTQEAIVKAAQ